MRGGGRAGFSPPLPAGKGGGLKPALLEQGRRKPDGPARVLLALIARDPGMVQRGLG